MAMGFRGVIMSRFADVYTSFMFYFSTDAKDICVIVARIKSLVTNQFPHYSGYKVWKSIYNIDDQMDALDLVARVVGMQRIA
ncbi:hypothetical protein L6452_02447 [Arctium lappa]|uniref:Uncharacterized protein n=1 Tax=Arctium lappa TaxID=4217 RepID=A0ACB9FKC5_ARCLA|nr:hypothetical protein L6452_02447 [Arctium lappa]